MYIRMHASTHKNRRPILLGFKSLIGLFCSRTQSITRAHKHTHVGLHSRTRTCTIQNYRYNNIIIACKRPTTKMIVRLSLFIHVQACHNEIFVTGCRPLTLAYWM